MGNELENKNRRARASNNTKYYSNVKRSTTIRNSGSGLRRNRNVQRTKVVVFAPRLVLSTQLATQRHHT
jgi:hypothetical protein